MLKNTIDKWLPKNSFVRNIITLMSGTVFAQVLLIACSPLLTRLYSPASFGIYSYYTSIVSIFAVIACLRYEYAIVLPPDDSDAANLLFISVFICFAMSLLAMLLVFVFRSRVAIVLNTPILSKWLWLIPMSVLIAGMFQSFNYWSIRKKQFKHLAIRQVTENSVTLMAQISSGLFGILGSGGLIAGSILGKIVATGKLGSSALKADGNKIIESISLLSIKKNLLKYKNFPLFDLWAGLLSTASSALMPLLMGIFFDTIIVGFFGLANRIVVLPTGILGNALYKAFFPKAASVKNDKSELCRLTERYFMSIFSLTFIPFVILFLCSPYLFPIIFGEEWGKTGTYIRYLCPWAFCDLCLSPLVSLFQILKKQFTNMIICIVMVIVRISCIIIGGTIADDLFAIRLFGVANFLLIVFNIVYIFFLLKISLFKMFSFFLKNIARMVLYIIPIIFVIIFIKSSVYIVAISIASGLVFCVIKARDIKTILAQ